MLRKICFFLIAALLGTCLMLSMGSADVAWADEFQDVDSDLIEWFEDGDEYGFIIYPSGDMSGKKDAHWIDFALGHSKQVGGPNFVVELAAGHYYISKCIEAYGFSGTLKGAGKEETVIEVIKGDYVRETPSGPRARLFFVYDQESSVERTIGLEGMTITVTASQPADVYENPFVGPTTALNNICFIMWGNVNTHFEDLKVSGGPGDGNGYNIIYPLGVESGTGKNHSFINCDVENVAIMAMEYWDLPVSPTIKVEGATFTNCRRGLALVNLGPNPQAEILNCEFTGCLEPALFIRAAPNTEVIGNKFVDFASAGNWFHTPIFFRNDNHDCLISGNTFTNISENTPAVILVSRRDNNSENIIQCNTYSGVLPDCLVKIEEASAGNIGNKIYENIERLQICDDGINTEIDTEYPCP